jgi:hypothetical protein
MKKTALFVAFLIPSLALADPPAKEPVSPKAGGSLASFLSQEGVDVLWYKGLTRDLAGPSPVTAAYQEEIEKANGQIAVFGTVKDVIKRKFTYTLVIENTAFNPNYLAILECGPGAGKKALDVTRRLNENKAVVVSANVKTVRSPYESNRGWSAKPVLEIYKHPERTPSAPELDAYQATQTVIEGTCKAVFSLPAGLEEDLSERLGAH